MLEQQMFATKVSNEVLKKLKHLSLPSRYSPLHNNNICPYCRYAFYETLNTNAEHVFEVERLNCHGIFDFDDRMKFKNNS